MKTGTVSVTGNFIGVILHIEITIIVPFLSINRIAGWIVSMRSIMFFYDGHHCYEGFIAGTLWKIVMMRTNMMDADRIIRMMLAQIFGTLYFAHAVTVGLGTALLVAGTYYFLTSFTGFCPIYKMARL